MTSSLTEPLTDSPGNANADRFALIRRLLAALNGEKLLTMGLLFAAVAFNLYALHPEVAIHVPSLNDNALHLQSIVRAVVAIASGQDPSDAWMSAASSFGYPFFRYYQNLPYVLPAVIYLPLALLTRGALTPTAWFDWLRYFLLAIFPLSIYWSMRRVGFERLPSALAALLASLVSTNGLIGLEYGSYVFRGGGVYTQIWGMLLLPPALAFGWNYLRNGQGWFWSVVLVSATVLSHLIFAYMTAGSLLVLALFALPGVPLGKRLGRLLAIGLPAGLVTSYFLVPIFLEGVYRNHSVFEPQWHLDSFGAPWVLNALVRGDLFDFGRLPALTLLAAIGFAACLWRWREPRYRLPVLLFVLWLLLFFGRPTWGALLDILPLTRELTYHRLITGVHLGGIMLAGIGLALPWTWAWSYRDGRLLLAPAILSVLLLAPVYQERLAFMGQDAALMVSTRSALNAQGAELQHMLETIQALPPGRVYAGLPGTWGKDFLYGSVPMYDVLYADGLDMLGYPFPAWSLNSDLAWGFADGRVEQYNLFNVRYVVVPAGWKVPAFYRPLGDFGRQQLYAVETSGYFDLVDSTYAFYGKPAEFYPAALLWLNSDLPRQKLNPGVLLGNTSGAGDYAWLSPLTQAATVVPETTVPLNPVRGRVTAETIGTNSYAADVNVESGGLLMLKVTYHPNWHAVVDGVEKPTVMLMPSFLGVRLPPGTHHVLFEYRPPAYRYLLMLLGLLTLLSVAVIEGRPAWWQKNSIYRWIKKSR